MLSRNYILYKVYIAYNYTSLSIVSSAYLDKQSTVGRIGGCGRVERAPRSRHLGALDWGDYVWGDFKATVNVEDNATA